MNATGQFAEIAVSGDGSGVVGQAGALLLLEALRVAGLDRGLSVGLDR